MMAAAAAKEKGADVILIEKEKTINLMRVGIASVGSNAQKRAGTQINKRDLVESLAAFAQHNCDERLLNTWVDNSAESVNWLEDHILKPNGAHFRSEPDAMVTSKAYQGFPTENDPAIDDQSFVSYGDWFVKYQEETGVDMRYQTSLVKLIKEGDTVTGAIVKDLAKDEFYQIDASKGVIIATGGYSANKKLLEKWDPLALKKNVYNDSPSSNGAGITAALNVGAMRDEEPAETIFDRGLVPVGTKTEDMYYQTATYDHGLWIGSYPFLKVNLRGERFSNESIPYQFIVNAASKEPYRITPIKKAPYYGCILGGRILCTFDGLRVNTKMEVLDKNYNPIKHLYAGGNDSGGFFWGSYNDSVPGLASGHAQTFGRLAGKNAAEN